jgi:hypothetical protein
MPYLLISCDTDWFNAISKISALKSINTFIDVLLKLNRNKNVIYL